MTYLEDHPPARSQFRTQRRAQVTGAIVIHTAENSTDVELPDGGAEAVARFISTRPDPGSYHSVVDSDSIVHVGRYEWEMFHEGTGGNRWSLGLAFACQADQWPDPSKPPSRGRLPAGWITRALINGATEAASMAAWVKETTGVIIPATHITPAEYRTGKPGFIGHGELDPGRRHDPGPHFPWDRFLAYYDDAPLQETPPMPPEDFLLPGNRDESIRRIQRALGVTVDGDPHTGTALAAEALKTRVDHQTDLIEALQAELLTAGDGMDLSELDRLRAEHTTLTGIRDALAAVLAVRGQ